MEYLQSEEIENNETLEKARMLIVKYTTKHLMSLKLEYKDLINNNDFIEIKDILNKLKQLKTKNPIMEELFRKI